MAVRKTPKALDESPEKPAIGAVSADEEIREMDFEAGLQQLEKTLKELEGGSLTLSAALEAYRSGIGLVRALHAQLDRADQLIVELCADGTERVMKPEELDG